MPSHKSHRFAYVEPERHDELSDGIADPLQEAARQERRASGSRIAKGASLVPALGGRALKHTTKLSHRIDHGALPEEWARRARTLRKAMTTETASTVGGGTCGVQASLLLKFASQKTAAAEMAFQAGDFEMHRKLSESARMDIVYAREHAAKTALARRDGAVDQGDPLAAFRKPPVAS